MPLQTVEHWLQEAAQAREAAEGMRDEKAKAAMLGIAVLFDHLAEQTRRLERLGVTAQK